MLYLIRASGNQYGTYGVLVKPTGEAFAVTLERPWANNSVGLSRIPAGVYRVKKYKSDKYPNTYQIMGVPGRDKILFHIGCKPKDTKGCVLVGEQFEGKDIYYSSKGFGEFMTVALGLGTEFDLKIVDPLPELSNIQ